jgi:hypothetical protein
MMICGIAEACSLIGETNSLVYYFGKLNSRGKRTLYIWHILLRTYIIGNAKIDTYSVSMRYSSRRVRGLSIVNHQVLL